MPFGLYDVNIGFRRASLYCRSCVCLCHTPVLWQDASTYRSTHSLYHVMASMSLVFSASNFIPKYLLCLGLIFDLKAIFDLQKWNDKNIYFHFPTENASISSVITQFLGCITVLRTSYVDAAYCYRAISMVCRQSPMQKRLNRSRCRLGCGLGWAVGIVLDGGPAVLRDIAMSTLFDSRGGLSGQAIQWRHSRDRLTKGHCHGNQFGD